MNNFLRSYFQKDNTLIFDDLTNTGLNPVTELWYGRNELNNDLSYTRFIFEVDLSYLREKYNNGEIQTGDTSVRHILKMYNTGLFEQNLLGDINAEGRIRASSFDLELYKIYQYWDDGVGYDFPDIYRDALFSKRFAGTRQLPSNWTARTSTANWNAEGAIFDPAILWGSTAYTFNQLSAVTFEEASPPMLGSQHFRLGNENLEIDITDWVNEIIQTSATTYGFILKYPFSYEQLNGILSSKTTVDTVGFFTSKADSFYEPYVETAWDSVIEDDRNFFYLDKENKLFLYVTENNNFSNLDRIPSAVTITDHCNAVVSSFTGTQISQLRKGVYYVDFTLDSATHNPNMSYKDTWKGLVKNGINKPNVINKFITLDGSKFLSIGSLGPTQQSNLGYFLKGMGQFEKLKMGEKRRLWLELYKRDLAVNKKQVITDTVRWRLYVKEGKNQIDVIPKAKLNRTTEGMFFEIDTTWLLPNEYYIEIIFESDSFTSFSKYTTEFTVIQPLRDPVI